MRCGLFVQKMKIWNDSIFLTVVIPSTFMSVLPVIFERLMLDLIFFKFFSNFLRNFLQKKKKKKEKIKILWAVYRVWTWDRISRALLWWNFVGICYSVKCLFSIWQYFNKNCFIVVKKSWINLDKMCASAFFTENSNEVELVKGWWHYQFYAPFWFFFLILY